MSVIENRRHFRLPLNQKFVLGFEFGVYAGQCVNISAGGGFVNLLDTTGISHNDECHCLFVTKHNERPLNFTARVKRVVAPSPNPESLSGVGLEFDKNDTSNSILENSIEEMRNEYELISTVLGHGEPEISSLQPLLESLNLKPFMDMGELKNYVERVLRAVELVEKHGPRR